MVVVAQDKYEGGEYRCRYIIGLVIEGGGSLSCASGCPELEVS